VLFWIFSWVGTKADSMATNYWKIHALITATFFQVCPCPYLVNSSLDIQVSFFKF